MTESLVTVLRQTIYIIEDCDFGQLKRETPDDYAEAVELLKILKDNIEDLLNSRGE